MAKKELPDNEDLFTIDTPDIEDAEGGWDDWDDVDVDVDVAPEDDLDVVPAIESQLDVDDEDIPVASTVVPEQSASASDEADMEVPTLEEDWGDADWEEDESEWSDEEDVDIDVPQAPLDDTAETEAAISAEEETERDTPIEEEIEAPAQEELSSFDEQEITDSSVDVDVEPLQPAEEQEAPRQDVAEEPAEAQVIPAEPMAAEEEVVEDVPADVTPVTQDEEPHAGEEMPIEEASNAEPQTDVAEEGESPVAPESDQEEGEAAPEEPQEEAVRSEEEIAREQEELEAYRSAMGESTAEMADISEYRKFRKKTKTESTSSKPKRSDFDLFANRYKVKTMNAMVAASDPIVYFYNACLRNNGSILAFNVYQVLQDRFLGKMVPQLFTAVAENSAKIEELNEANLIEQLKICAEYTQYEFIISISARFFTKPALLERLLKVLPEGGVPNLVLAFDCSSLENIAIAAKAGLSNIRQRGVKVLLDNTERVTMTVLSEFDYDYIRIDSRYYEMGNPRAEAYLRLLLQLAKEQGVKTIATFCDSEDLSEYMFFMGVDAVQGNAVSRPMRTVPNSVKAITLLPSMLDA